MSIKPKMTDNAQQDHALVESALWGDEKAFVVLMKKYKDHIYFMLVNLVNNHDDAEDLTIEAFEKAFTNLHTFSADFSFSTWLHKIAYNNGVDFLRKKKGSPVLIENDSEDYRQSLRLKSMEQNPEQKMIRNQKAILLRNFVRRLKPYYRTLVEYRYFREYSCDEIAEKMSQSLGTIKAGLFRARAMLFKMIESTEMDDTKRI